MLSVALCEGIQDSLGFWTPRCGFRIRKTGFQTPCQWSWDSGYHEQKICRNPVTLKRCFQELSYDAYEAIPGADEFQVQLSLAIYTLDISILVLKVLCFFPWMEWVNPR